jgi:hypothetical protein
MRYMDNPELFSDEEMRENDTEAYAAAEAAAYTAAYTAEAAAYADAANIDKYWVNKYFKFTDENKQDYTNEVERLK